MPQPKSKELLADVLELMYRALETERGIRATFLSEAEAYKTYMRIGSARKKIREENRRIYPVDHELHGKDPWQRFAIFWQGSDVEIRPAKLPDTVIIREL